MHQEQKYGGAKAVGQGQKQLPSGFQVCKLAVTVSGSGGARHVMDAGHGPLAAMPDPG